MVSVLIIAPLHDVEILRKWMAERRIEYTILTWLDANRLGVELNMHQHGDPSYRKRNLRLKRKST